MKFNNIFISFLILFLINSSSQAQDKNKTEDNTTPKTPPETLKIEKVFPGPFRDTIIQRVVDQKNGVVCYVYVPVVAEPSKVATEKTPRVYGPNNIGSISCLKK
jgi:hypothetical protein